MGVWLLGGLQLGIEYSGTLESFLIIPPHSRLDSMEDLVREILANRIRPCTIGSYMYVDIWREAAEDPHQSDSSIAVLGRHYKTCLDADDCLQMVLGHLLSEDEERLAFFANSNILLAKAKLLGIENFLMPNIQRSTFMSDRLALVLPKGSPLRSFINKM